LANEIFYDPLFEMGAGLDVSKIWNVTVGLQNDFKLLELVLYIVCFLFMI
jgi:hypothetical protein